MRAGKPNLLQDPTSRYTSPEHLLRDPALSNRAKRALLRHWKSDLTLLLTATEENMPVTVSPDFEPSPSDGENAEMLQRVSNCLLRLDAGRQVAAVHHEQKLGNA
jgi:hypothetical protein